jgi:hypothetical protein
MATGLADSKAHLVIATHHRQHAVLRPGLPARHRGIHKMQALMLGQCLENSRATLADAVVWSTRTAPGFMPQKRHLGPW